MDPFKQLRIALTEAYVAAKPINKQSVRLKMDNLHIQAATVKNTLNPFLVSS